MRDAIIEGLLLFASIAFAHLWWEERWHRKYAEMSRDLWHRLATKNGRVPPKLRLVK